jgi:hypothetical protein
VEDTEMPDQEQRQTDRIIAVDDDGDEYVIIEYTTFIEFRPISGPATWTKGTKELRLDTGQHVNWIDDDTFQIVSNDRVLRRLK